MLMSEQKQAEQQKPGDGHLTCRLCSYPIPIGIALFYEYKGAYMCFACIADSQVFDILQIPHVFRRYPDLCLVLLVAEGGV
jgi:hypothetical protein